MIPESELTRLQEAITDAFRQGEAGLIRYGAQILKQGASRAEQCARAGEAWGEEVERRYQESLRQFKERYPL